MEYVILSAAHPLPHHFHGKIIIIKGNKFIVIESLYEKTTTRLRLTITGFRASSDINIYIYIFLCVCVCACVSEVFVFVLFFFLTGVEMLFLLFL